MQINSVMDEIHEGMHVYDSTNNNFGHVAYIHIAPTEPDTTMGLDDEILPLNESESVRQELVDGGFIRIENSLFSGASFVRATEIDRVDENRVYLNIKQNEVIRE